MYNHILIATDGSELGAKAVDQGLDLAKQLDAKVTAITVTEPWTAAAYGTIPTPTLIKVYDKAAADNAARILASVQRRRKETASRVRYSARERPLPRGRHHRHRQGQGLATSS